MHPAGWEDGGPERLLGPDLPLVLRDRAPRVMVVGDPILDGWWRGRTERMSREAPAPVVEVFERRHVPGGAANTAVNLAALGAQVSLVGVVGDDEAGHMLRSLLLAAGVDVTGLVLAPEVRTTTKVRIVGGEQILLRLDEGTDTSPPEEIRDRAVLASAAVLRRSDAVVVCDYGSGPSPALVRALQHDRPPLLVVDAHDPAPWAEVAPDLVTPNAGETFRLLGRVPPTTARVEAVHAAAAEIIARTGATQVVVTLDAEGAVLIDSTGVLHRTTARPVLDKQATGAGDTFVAALTLARAAGTELPVALELAQAAADVVVHRTGTSVCTADDLADHLGRTRERVLTGAELALRVQAERAAGRRVVLTNGCFDVLHRGHTTSLAQAARLGDLLVVAVNSDESVRRLKGPQRPINTAADRAGVLAALSVVDYVTVFETDTPIPLLELLQPDVYAKGGDYTPEMMAETAVVRSYGGEVRILDFVPAHSTTDVVTRIRGMAPEA